MSRPPGLQRLVQEQQAARLRSPRVPEVMFLSSWMNGDVQDINRLNNRLMRMVKESMDRQNGIKAYGEAVNRMNQYNDKKRNLGLKSMGLK